MMLSGNVGIAGNCFEMLHIHVFFVSPLGVPATCRSLAQTSIRADKGLTITLLNLVSLRGYLGTHLRNIPWTISFDSLYISVFL